MTASPLDADAGAAQIADDSHAIRAVGKMAAIILVVEPDAGSGFGNDSGNPLLENLKCHDRKLLYVWCGVKCGHPQTTGKTSRFAVITAHQCGLDRNKLPVGRTQWGCVSSDIAIAPTADYITQNAIALKLLTNNLIPVPPITAPVHLSTPVNLSIADGTRAAAEMTGGRLKVTGDFVVAHKNPPIREISGYNRSDKSR